MPIEAGRLDRRIVLQQPTVTRDSVGGPVESWSTVATVWAGYRPQRGDEVFAARQRTATREAVFTIRHRTDVTESTRIVFDGHNWDIVHIAELDRRAGLEIRATAQGDRTAS